MESPVQYKASQNACKRTKLSNLNYLMFRWSLRTPDTASGASGTRAGGPDGGGSLNIRATVETRRLRQQSFQPPPSAHAIRIRKTRARQPHSEPDDYEDGEGIGILTSSLVASSISYVRDYILNGFRNEKSLGSLSSPRTVTTSWESRWVKMSYTLQTCAPVVKSRGRNAEIWWDEGLPGKIEGHSWRIFSALLSSPKELVNDSRFRCVPIIDHFGDLHGTEFDSSSRLN